MTAMSPSWLQKCIERCSAFGLELVTRNDSSLGQKTSRGSTYCHHQLISGSSDEDRECYDIELRGNNKANASYSNTFLLCLNENRVRRHRLRMDRLSHLIQKRSTIEAKMLASSQNVENAFIYAGKALAFALERRLQSIAKQQKVGYKFTFPILVEADETFRHRLHDKLVHHILQRYNDRSTLCSGRSSAHMTSACEIFRT